MTWVKICGITNLEDAKVAVDGGADALGFVFYEKSPRYLTPKAASKIIETIPQTLEKVAVFANANAEEACAAARISGATAVQALLDVSNPDSSKDRLSCFEQLTRGETPFKLIPALSMQRENPERDARMWDARAIYAFLLESAARTGGSGRQFNWTANQVPTNIIKNLANVIVAGGLTPTNVSEAMRILKPWGVDVSSGVETAPGKKDPAKVSAFIAAVRRADKEQ
ncbi:MAG TPA: phosphoribosylanthranilate isomerase [Terriglobales bacterium]|nr:phosphoribosylanthranilate isomerase [Terriglobales bacterium]